MKVAGREVIISPCSSTGVTVVIWIIVSARIFGLTMRSSQPPNPAAAAPSVMPQTTEMAMAVALTESEVRAP